MAVSCEKGTFAIRTTAGSQTVNLVDTGLTPKIVFLWVVDETATGYGTPLNFHIGAGTSSAQDRCFGVSSDDAATSTNTNRRHATTRILHTSSTGSGTADLEADLTSFAAGNFIINVVANATATAQIIHYFVIGGSDLTNVKVGSFASDIDTGNNVTTDPGFQPDIVFMWTAGATSTSTSNGSISMAVAKSSSERAGLSWVSDDANAAGGNCGCYQRSDLFLIGLTASSPGTADFESDFVSMDTNGFTFNYSNAPAGAYVLGYAAMKFTSSTMCDMGVETQQTSATTKTTSGLSVIPKGALFFGTARAASASIDTGATSGRLSFGGSDGTHEGGIAIHDTDGADPTQVAQRTYDDKAFATMTADTTTTGEADCSFSGSAGEFTLNWTTSDGTAREFIYIVFGDTAPAGGGPTPLLNPIGQTGVLSVP